MMVEVECQCCGETIDCFRCIDEDGELAADVEECPYCGEDPYADEATVAAYQEAVAADPAGCLFVSTSV